MCDPARSSEGEAVAHLRAEVADLRLQLAEEVRSRRVVIVDEAGVARIRLTADEGGDVRMVLLGEDGFERTALTGKSDIGTVAISARSGRADPTRVDVFALDPDDGDPAYVGVELVDGGDTTGGFTLYEGRSPRVWPGPGPE